MESATIVLPAGPAETRRQPLPLLAAIVPVIAGVVLWLVTGSLFALCFAALGPLMLVASFLDGLRSRGTERRRAQEHAAEAWRRADAELRRLHAEEHTDAWRRAPGVVECLIEPPLRGRNAPSPDTTVVLGRGAQPSRVTASGDDSDASRAFRRRAQQLDDAPVAVPLGGGICVRAPHPVAAAVVRALVTQLCLPCSPTQLGLIGEALEPCALEGFPHATSRQVAFRLRVGDEAGRADAVICVRVPGEEPPEGITTVLDCTVPAQARLRTGDGVRELSVEALSARQTRMIAADAAERTGAEPAVPNQLGFDELPHRTGAGLGAVLARGEGGDLHVDLVEDGPHAIVTGMTGTGKSELLTSWIAAIAAVHSPEDVSFVLVDFKGGTAFDRLRGLPHVVAVITDLDADGARRGVGSLTAELRRRETALAEAGVRDVSECPGLARLVIVVDEFAALLQEHPDLGEIFTDVAARGRALGMHLVLGTQRASGVIRDALASNCPLRVSLRVVEPVDSRFVIGSDAAAGLPGGVESRGLALVRRPRDSEVLSVRIALTAEDDLSAIAQRWEHSVTQLSPWLPPLPGRLALPAGVSAAGDARAVLGRADEPERQRQPWVHLRPGEALAIVGGPGAGKTAAVRLLAAQLPGAVLVPRELEDAWDAVAELATGSHGPVLCDDLDVLAAQYPPEYAQLFLSRWESIVRSPAGTVVTVSRASGAVGRLIDGFASRALLRMSSRIEHISAGGEPSWFDPRRGSGRAWMDGREVQMCWTEPDEASCGLRPGPAAVETWTPARACSGVVTPAVQRQLALLTGRHPAHRVQTLTEASAEGCDLADGQPRVLVGDPEEWRAQWGRLQSVRTGGELLIDADCPAELRQLAGVRELPPYARAHAGRAWAVRPGRRPRRVLLS